MKEQAQDEDDQCRRDNICSFVSRFSSALKRMEGRREGGRHGGLQQADMVEDYVGKVDQGGCRRGSGGGKGGKGCRDKG